MFDVGEHLHAFDAAALAGDKIIVRPAKEGETFVTLDGGKHKLDSSVLVIADEKKAVALAGIMGGLESGIKETTTRVVLEAANFNPVTIRRAATKLGLRTDASAR